MVERHIYRRGVRSEKVLDAMRKVPRERFIPNEMKEFAYEDSPLPIGDGQTISQPYIVAFMIEALALQGGEKVLEIGAGSGYAAAILGEIAEQVFAIERIENLAKRAKSVLADMHISNVTVICGDGTVGLAEEAPFDAIVVAAGGPAIPESLKQQLKPGGRLVIPVGASTDSQELIRITRLSDTEFKQEDLAAVRFVPLVGSEGWQPTPSDSKKKIQPSAAQNTTTDSALHDLIADGCDPFQSVADANLDPLLARIGDAEIVLIGEASHGTAEFYRMRNRITRDLITKKGFNFIAIEGDWPDAARIDNYVRHFDVPPSEWTAFARFPTWMWRNVEVREFVDWLHVHNSGIPFEQRIAFHGLDLYSLYSSIREILKYLDEVDPETAMRARQRYGCLTPWQTDPATYGRAALTGSYRNCERDVTRMLEELLRKHRQYAEHDGERFLDAVQNARLVSNAERYYRVMYYGSRESWNLRDSYMFDTLKTLRDFHAPKKKAIVWAHNSHIGNSSATEMSNLGEINIGHLCKKEFQNRVYSIGFGTDHGTVAAASDWDGHMEVKRVNPALGDSYEHLFHQVGIPGFTLGMQQKKLAELKRSLAPHRLERAIGVIYQPETERSSHYFHASLPQQFDEYIWIDETTAVQAFDTSELAGLPDTYPFGI